MKILDALDREAIISDLVATKKSDTLKELALPLANAADLDPAMLVNVLTEREKLGSTGIGGGVAIPHGKVKDLTAITLGFGRSRQGVAFDSMDGKPTHIFFLLLTPENSTGLHLKMLARISRLLKQEPFRDKLLQAETGDELYQIIATEDEEF
jgi:PTS system nitrogen regulatory IIA component